MTPCVITLVNLINSMDSFSSLYMFVFQGELEVDRALAYVISSSNWDSDNSLHVSVRAKSKGDAFCSIIILSDRDSVAFPTK